MKRIYENIYKKIQLSMVGQLDPKYFLCSIISNEQYESLLLIILVRLDLFDKFILDWSSDVCFKFDVKDIVIFFNETETISDDELEVLKKFNIRGCDIFELLKNDCKERITDYNFEKG